MIYKPDCKRDHEKQNLDYVLWQCPILEIERKKCIHMLS